MQLFTDDEYDDMDDEERVEWDYRQRIEDQEERERNIAMANKNRGTDMGAILRKKDEDRRAAALAAWAERTAKVESIVDEPKVEVIVDEVIQEIPKVIILQEIPVNTPVEPSPKTLELNKDMITLEAESKTVSVNVDGVEEAKPPIIIKDDPNLVEDFSALGLMDFVKFDKILHRSDKLAGLSSSDFKLLMILATRLRPNGRVAIQIKGVVKYAEQFGMTAKTIRKSLKELKKYTFNIGKGKDTRTIHLLREEEIDAKTKYLRIPYESGIGNFDGMGKDYAYKVFFKWRREELEALLKTLGGSALRTLFIIGTHIDDEGMGFPLIAEIAKFQGLTPKFIGFNLNELENDARLLKRVHVPNDKNQYVHNEYYLDAKTGISFC